MNVQRFFLIVAGIYAVGAACFCGAQGRVHDTTAWGILAGLVLAGSLCPDDWL